MKFLNSLLALVVALLLVAPAADASPTKLKGDLTITGKLTTSGNSTMTGDLSFANTKGITAPAAGQTTRIGGTQLILSDTYAAMQKTLLVQAPLIIDVGGSISGIGVDSAKKQCFVVPLSPATGANADSVVYRGMIFPGRPGTVSRVTIGCQTPPTVGTDVIKVLKGSSAGATLLSTATFDANTLVANQGTAMTLTGTPADLGINGSGANSGIYCEYSAGVQTVDAIGINVTIEFTPTDF
jgi:hypothetical protein